MDVRWIASNEPEHLESYGYNVISKGLTREFEIGNNPQGLTVLVPDRRHIQGSRMHLSDTDSPSLTGFGETAPPQLRKNGTPLTCL